MNLHRIVTGTCAVLLLSAWLPPGAAAQDAGSPSEYYRVMDGKVDRGTYTGWQVFVENCAACHGPDANGTADGPSLVEGIKLLSVSEFRAKVLSRYFITVPLQDAVGEAGSAVREEMAEAASGDSEFENSHMPPWRHNPDVSGHIDQLYAYLSARADGVIGPGVPEVVEQ